MAISLTITVGQTSYTFDNLEAPLVQTPILGETDITTMDGNISTYFNYSKKLYTFNFAFMSADDFGKLIELRDLQYSSKTYASITITGGQNINVSNMVAKMSLNDQNVIDNCGTVENVELTFRESVAMP